MLVEKLLRELLRNGVRMEIEPSEEYDTVRIRFVKEIGGKVYVRNFYLIGSLIGENDDHLMIEAMFNDLMRECTQVKGE